LVEPYDTSLSRLLRLCVRKLRARMLRADVPTSGVLGTPEEEDRQKVRCAGTPFAFAFLDFVSPSPC
jgi:hypothetical protein